MTQGIQGTYVIAWSQVLVDGMSGVRPEDLLRGISWSWRGEAVRVDGPTQLLLLGQADEQKNIRNRAAKVVKKLIGAAVDNRGFEDHDEVGLADSEILLTDGVAMYTMTLIDTPSGLPLVMFVDEVPPPNQDFWVVDETVVKEPDVVEVPRSGGIICCSSDTYIETSNGAVPISVLKAGDEIQTQDSGLQTVLWIGQRRVSGARMHVMPQLRPVRIKENAFSNGVPFADIRVSPHQRIVVRGQVALDLFNAEEVLVAAKDLVNGRSVYTESRVSEITYYHILLERHEILCTNGLLTESCHPAHLDTLAIDDCQQDQLLRLFPDLHWHDTSSADNARRSLSQSEAALLKYAK